MHITILLSIVEKESNIPFEQFPVSGSFGEEGRVRIRGIAV
jgi:hypothetical protein